MNYRPKTSAGRSISLFGLLLSAISLYLAYKHDFALLSVAPGILGVIFCLLGISSAFKKNGAKGFSIFMLLFSLAFTSMSAGWIVIKAQGHDKDIHIFDNDDDGKSFDDKDMDELEDKMDDLHDEENKKNDNTEERKKKEEKKSDETTDNNKEEKKKDRKTNDDSKERKRKDNKTDDTENNKNKLDVDKLEEMRKKQNKTNDDTKERKRKERKTNDGDK